MEPSEHSIAAIYRQQTLDKWLHMGADEDEAVANLLDED